MMFNYQQRSWPIATSVSTICICTVRWAFCIGNWGNYWPRAMLTAEMDTYVCVCRCQNSDIVCFEREVMREKETSNGVNLWWCWLSRQPPTSRCSLRKMFSALKSGNHFPAVLTDFPFTLENLFHWFLFSWVPNTGKCFPMENVFLENVFHLKQTEPKYPRNFTHRRPKN